MGSNERELIQEREEREEKEKIISEMKNKLVYEGGEIITET